MFFFVVVVFIAILVLVHISLCLVGFPLQQQPSGPAPLATPPPLPPSRWIGVWLERWPHFFLFLLVSLFSFFTGLYWVLLGFTGF